jgi:hypothetical protein
MHGQLIARTFGGTITVKQTSLSIDIGQTEHWIGLIIVTLTADWNSSCSWLLINSSVAMVTSPALTSKSVMTKVFRLVTFGFLHEQFVERQPSTVCGNTGKTISTRRHRRRRVSPLPLRRGNTLTSLQSPKGRPDESRAAVGCSIAGSGCPWSCRQ